MRRSQVRVLCGAFGATSVAPQTSLPGGTVYTCVLETHAERIGSSNLPEGTLPAIPVAKINLNRQPTMSSNSTISSSGPGFFGWLQILFIGLKLTGYITWPWWQVLLPIIIGGGIALAALLIVGFVMLFAYISKR